MPRAGHGLSPAAGGYVDLRLRLLYGRRLAGPKEGAMRCPRIYATADGESHFDEVEIPTATRSIHPNAAPFEISASYPASRIRFTRIPAGMHPVGWHTVPERVLTLRLDGAVEYETSDGEVRKVPAGGFVLMEDTHGRGHLSRHPPEAQTVLWISMPAGLDEPLK